LTRVATGFDRLLSGDSHALDGRALGLIANPTTVDTSLRHAADVLAGDPRWDLRVLFGPEHGLRGDAQDMISVDSEADPRTGLPVHSLYGATEASLMPPDGSLDGLDALVFDIQDVGARYYTYVWTMVYAMRACARAGVAMIVLDRPNPIDGVTVEGGLIEPGHASFVGLEVGGGSVPNRHGLTAGEIAGWARAREGLDLDLTVVEMKGWERTMRYGDTGLPWVLPSPNMPTVDTALVYPGMCLVEGTELSEGRGTTRPFELAGAPWIDGYRLADALAAEHLPGLVARPLTFRPTFQKHGGTPCGGVQLHVTDPRAYRSYLTGVAFVRAARALDPELFEWRTRAYEFVDDVPAFDLLAGTGAVRSMIEAGASLGDIAATWEPAQRAFAAARREWLLY
jgi:uncharacterized protein YbbC (DUF1343 family)